MVPRMMEKYLSAEAVVVNMGIDTSSLYALMSQHSLYGPQTGATCQKMGGKGMAQGVRANGLLYASQLGKVFDEAEYHDTPYVLYAAMHGDKDIVSVRQRNGPSASVGEIVIEALNGARGNGHQPFLASFARHLDESLVEIQVGHPEVAQLADTQPATIQHLHYGEVSMTFFFAEVDT